MTQEIVVTRLEETTIQVMTGEKGVVLYFDTFQETERAYWRIKLANDPMAYAEAIHKRQQEEMAPPGIYDD